MEFWGVEVKAGEPLKVKPEFGKLIHISQVALGEGKNQKESKNIPLRLKIDSKSFIIGHLDAEDRTQLLLDLVFEKEFELSHDWKNGSIYFVGYTADEPVEPEDDLSDEDDLEDEPVHADIVRSLASSGAVKAKGINEGETDSEEEEEDSSDDSDDELEDDSSDEELPQEKSKKRPAESPKETPAAAKKAKSAAADKKGNQNGNAATPGKTPKSGGQLSCKSCSKTFSNDKALQSHTKAKHGGK